jgi:hypothetical protein
MHKTFGVIGVFVIAFATSLAAMKLANSSTTVAGWVT